MTDERGMEMTKGKLYLPFYYEWEDTLSLLDDVDYGRLLRAVMVFARTGKDSDRLSELTPMAQMAYKFIASCITRSEKKRLAGQKGGLARGKSAKGINSASTPTKTKENGKNALKTCENTGENATKKVESPTNTKKRTPDT